MGYGVHKICIENRVAIPHTSYDVCLLHEFLTVKTGEPGSGLDFIKRVVRDCRKKEVHLVGGLRRIHWASRAV